MSSTDPRRQASKRSRAHARTGLICALVVVGMTGAAFAAVPLYKAFCQATGWAGTARKAAIAPDKVLSQQVTVYFDTNVASGLPWSFEALQRSQKVKIGGTNIAFFKVVNNSDQAITGRAAYNVTPDQAGQYVRKLQCFCFSAQTLQPHQAMQFPVVYFVDPGWAKDAEMHGISDLTLSYTFVPDPAEAPKRAKST
jgi:cytochrome c oxidase assembly protein subunit 11